MEIAENIEIAKFINNLDVKILNCGYADIDKTWNCGEFKSLYSRIYVTVDGKGEVINEKGETTELLPGEVCFIPTGATFRYKCDSHMKQIFFHVNYLKADGFDLFEDYEHIHTIKPSLEDKYTDRESFLNPSIDTAVRYMSLLLSAATEVLCNSELKDVAAKSLSPIIEKAVRKIREAKSIKISISDIAQELYVSESMLSRKFKEDMGVPFGVYVDKLIFNEARRDVSTGKYSIKEISTKYGFCDEFYFSRRFKQLFGLTPSVYKKMFTSYLPL